MINKSVICYKRQMELSPKQQICELVQKAKKILITFGKNSGGDGVGSALGLALILKAMNKEVQIISSVPLPKKFSYLPLADKIIRSPALSRDYILSIKVPKDTINQLRYEVEDERLNIYITAKGSVLDNKNISLEPFRFKYDLIFVVNTPDLEDLGELYEKNTELFFEIPIINIDHHPSNEYFGKVNLIEIPSASTAEIITDLAGVLEVELDEAIANCLLTGIIAETNSFQEPSTTPKSFTTAAVLMAAGANHEEIVRFLYKTKPLSFLKLWGRVMNSLKYEMDLRLIWSLIEEKTFSETEANPGDLKQIIKEVAVASQDFDVIMFLYQRDKEIQGLIQAAKGIKIEKLAKVLKGKIQKDRIDFTVEAQSLAQAEGDMLGKIREWSQSR